MTSSTNINNNDQHSKEFQKLINRYIVQLRYGCTSSHCTYPHCFSCRRRLAKTPLRRPTLFTARMQAYVLATQNNPYAAVCQNTPRQIAQDKVEAQPAKKDSKSLTQCLFGTESIKYFEQHGELKPSTVVTFASPNVVSLPSHTRPTSESELTTTTREREICLHELKRLFVPPPELRASRSVNARYVQDNEAISILSRSWMALIQIPWTEIETGLPLVSRIVKAIAARKCHQEVLSLLGNNSKSDSRLLKESILSFSDDMILSKIATDPSRPLEVLRVRPYGQPHATAENSAADAQFIYRLIAWLEWLVRLRWSESPVVNRWEMAGAALETLEDITRLQNNSEIASLDAVLPNGAVLVSEALSLELTKSFLHFEPNPNLRHVLTFSLLLPLEARVLHFRAVNYVSMLSAYRSAQFSDYMIRLGLKEVVSSRAFAYLDNRLKVGRARFLTLDVRREAALDDAFDQLRAREKREIARPLKVIIGRSAGGGEQGLDQGGLTQEFFGLVAAKAFDDDCGMFVTDSNSRYSWFRPLSPVPLHKFELLGLLFSLAIYNGAIVPVNLPRFLYRQLLRPADRFSTNDIADGWPDLASGLRQLADWKEDDGDVADIFAREYKFSFETPDYAPRPLQEGWGIAATGSRGLTLEYDLQRYHRSETCRPIPNGVAGENGESSHILPNGNAESPAHAAPSESEMVTNQNRHDFVEDYVRFLLTDSVRPQYEAFAKGFHTCINPKALSILDPELLQQLVEGVHELDVGELERVATYENGYAPQHPLIRAFWAMVRAWPAEQQRKLLEFVTASDRVPVTGLGTVPFCITRNGATDMLPTSQTCFGKLTIPEYEDLSVLRRMFDVALEYGQGFGVV